MLSISQLGFILILFVGLGGWWVARSFHRRDLEEQIEQTLDALDSAAEYWLTKLSEPHVSAYAETYLLSLEVERSEVRQMQTMVATGERLTLKQLVRLDKLVSKHLVEAPAPTAAAA